ncbi:hypothetical protein JCM5350_000144 [Sporobolomyces pararoseus]
MADSKKKTKSSSSKSGEAKSPPSKGMQKYRDFYKRKSAELREQDPDMKDVKKLVNEAWKEEKEKAQAEEEDSDE